VAEGARDQAEQEHASHLTPFARGTGGPFTHRRSGSRVASEGGRRQHGHDGSRSFARPAPHPSDPARRVAHRRPTRYPRNAPAGIVTRRTSSVPRGRGPGPEGLEVGVEPALRSVWLVSWRQRRSPRHLAGCLGVPMIDTSVNQRVVRGGAVRAPFQRVCDGNQRRMEDIVTGHQNRPSQIGPKRRSFRWRPDRLCRMGDQIVRVQDRHWPRASLGRPPGRFRRCVRYPTCG
jgi:hypothetical protein